MLKSEKTVKFYYTVAGTKGSTRIKHKREMHELRKNASSAAILAEAERLNDLENANRGSFSPEKKIVEVWREEIKTVSTYLKTEG